MEETMMRCNNDDGEERLSEAVNEHNEVAGSGGNRE